MPADVPVPRRRWKRWLAPVLSTFALLLVGLAIPLLWIANQGKSGWARTEAELRARGEKLTLAELAPKLPPPGENFYADPMWEELSDMVLVVDSAGNETRQPRIPQGKRILDGLSAPASAKALEMAKLLFPASERPVTSPPDPSNEISRKASALLQKTSDPAERQKLARLILLALESSKELQSRITRLLAEKPAAVFPNDYSLPAGPALPQLSYQLKLAKIFKDSADAHLLLGERNAARENALTTLRLARTLQSDPTLIGLLVRISITGMGCKTIETGILQHSWKSGDLAEFSRELRKIDLVKGLADAMRGERGFFNQFIGKIRSGRGSGITWSSLLGMTTGMSAPSRTQDFIFSALYPLTADGDQDYYNRHLQTVIDALESPGGVSPTAIPPDQAKEDVWFKAMHMMSSLGIPSLVSAIRRTLYTQERIQQTILACALEEYRLAHGAYPASLGVLGAYFLPPGSTLAAQTIQYRLESGDTFTLWSPGWNGVNDGGTASPNRSDYQSSDWVWGRDPGQKP